MFYTFLKQKIALIGVALLIVAVGVFFGLQSGSSSHEESVSQPPFGSSSTLSASVGQETAWPPLLIESQSGVSEDLEAALDRAMAKAGLPPAPKWCDFLSDGKTTPAAILNEVAWMGSLQNPNDEWIEIADGGIGSANMEGWQLLNQGGKIKIALGPAASSSRTGFLVLRRASGGYSGALSNSGDWLKVFNGDCKLVDELNASSGWPAGDNAAKKTLERDASGSGWHTSVNVGGSPGAKNSEQPLPISNPVSVPASVATSTIISASTSSSVAVTTSSVPTVNVVLVTSTPTSTQISPTPVESPIPTTTYQVGHAVIYSLQITGGEGVTDEDYIKIFNPSVGSINVSGWKLRKKTQSGTESSIKVFPDGSMIAPGGYFVWANSANGFASNIGANVSSTQILSSDNSVALFDPEGILIDAVAWGSGHVTPYIEGSAYPENPGPVQKLSRKLEAGNARDMGNNAQDFELD